MECNDVVLLALDICVDEVITVVTIVVSVALILTAAVVDPDV